MNGKDVDEILERLESCGFEAYTVGGCVRDTIMGRSAHDTDITTNALPEQVIAAFDGYKVIPTGLKHGTVTILKNSVPYEITTYRIDGEYKDSRRPETVEFTASITEDLARRDFTMNAIAMDRHGNIADPFGGKDDIGKGIIRCVGDPVQRFSEDALRIMRAVRFAAQLGFSIEEKTAEAVHSMKGRLKNISVERIRSELDKLLCGKYCVEV
ncbi:MAG: CCA tRNA nucleotidyltransferase, partial [Ruminococcus sp.]|nr:CCA tRNA nucleotidyltransferase [Ruminococcus sp.]